MSIKLPSHTKKYVLRYGQYLHVLEGYNDLIELQILRNQNQLADTYLLLKEQQYLRNLPNKRVLPDLH